MLVPGALVMCSRPQGTNVQRRGVASGEGTALVARPALCVRAGGRMCFP